ncbi:MAG: hypothetical protein JSU00_16855 [Acidobacteria bacterium]|nr:hypothetical protein [Acidobacteriota bacterium]
MSALLVFTVYGTAALIALAALWRFGVQHWYWHTASVAAAFAIGLAPLPEPWNQPVYTLVVGWLFTALFLWGIGAPVVAALHHSPDMHLHHR